MVNGLSQQSDSENFQEKNNLLIISYDLHRHLIEACTCFVFLVKRKLSVPSFYSTCLNLAAIKFVPFLEVRESTQEKIFQRHCKKFTVIPRKWQ